MNETREVKDLAIGDVIQVQGFDGNFVVRSAKKIRKGLDAGKFEVALETPDGEKEQMAFAPEERVKVVDKDPEAGKGKSGGKGKGKGKAKVKARAKREPEVEAEPEPEAQTSEAPASEPEAKTSKKNRRPKKVEGEKKMSCLDAAARVLEDAGQPMNCQEMIKAMAEKSYWTSPGGKTPHATLYSAILRELQDKGKDARFQKTERGKFTVGKES